jgi:hypothetical protein
MQDTSVDVTLFSSAVLTWVALQTYAVALNYDGLGNATITRDGVTGDQAAQRPCPWPPSNAGLRQPLLWRVDPAIRLASRAIRL